MNFRPQRVPWETESFVHRAEFAVPIDADATIGAVDLIPPEVHPKADADNGALTPRASRSHWFVPQDFWRSPTRSSRPRPQCNPLHIETSYLLDMTKTKYLC